MSTLVSSRWYQIVDGKYVHYATGSLSPYEALLWVLDFEKGSSALNGGSL